VLQVRPPEEITAPPIVIRRYGGDELESLIETVKSSLDHLRPWMPWAWAEPLEPSLTAFLTGAVEDFDRGGNFNYALWDSARLSFVGGAGLHPRLGPGRLEIGYWVRVGWLRRGVASAAARALTSAAFQLPGIDEVHIRCDEANVASAGVPRNLGFRLLRTVEDDVDAPGEVGRRMEWLMVRGRWDEPPGHSSVGHTGGV